MIIRRRDKVVRVLDRARPTRSIAFAVRRTAAGAELTFDNAADPHCASAQPGAGYKARWMALDNAKGIETTSASDIGLADARLSIPDAAWGPRDAAGSRYAIASISTVACGPPHWASPVLVTVRERHGAVDVVGIERPAGRDERRELTHT